MAIDANQITGALSETRVEALFLSWLWNVGRDRIDDGIDLFVEPERERFGGHRFLVQVKGTARNKSSRSIVAQVAKFRLRQYLASPIPIFIVRCTSDGELFWLHAQDWCRKNQSKISGSGNAGVTFTRSQKLSHQALFEEYLLHLFRAPSSIEVPSIVSLEKVLELRGLDPRLDIYAENSVDGQRIVFSPRESVQTTVRFTPTKKDFGSACDALGFGLPRDFSVSQFCVAGSPALESLTTPTLSIGRVQLSTDPVGQCAVRIFPCGQVSLEAEPLYLSAEIFRGISGGAVSNERSHSVLDFCARLSKDSPTRLISTLGLRWRELCKGPFRSAEEMRKIYSWSEAFNQTGKMTFEFRPAGAQRFSVCADDAGEVFAGLIDWARFLGKIHMICDALDSDFSLPSDPSEFRVDRSLVELVFALLKGERRRVALSKFEFSDAPTTSPSDGDRLLVTTNIELASESRLICTLPTRIDLRGYRLAKSVKDSKWRLIKGEDGEAWISHDYPLITGIDH